MNHIIHKEHIRNFYAGGSYKIIDCMNYYVLRYLHFLGSVSKKQFRRLYKQIRRINLNANSNDNNFASVIIIIMEIGK